MTKSELTKSYIADTFKKLAIERPIGQVYVLDIIQACDINRNTFYYHFADKLDLIVWIFRTEFAQVMLEEFPEHKLICDTEISNEKYRDLPFYIDTRSESGNLELGAYWLAVVNYLLSQSSYYNHVFCTEDCYSLKDYLYHIYFVQLKNDILYVLRGNKIPDTELTFLAGYFTNASVNYVINAYKNVNPYIMENPESSQLIRYNNITHDIIKGLCANRISQEQSI